MPRRPEPWYWKARKCWYVQVDGKQIKLDPDAKKARARWHRMMAESGDLDAREKIGLSVPDVADLFLGSRTGRRGGTIDRYERHLIPWAAASAKRKIGDVRLTDVVAYLNRKEHWGAGTKRSVFVLIVTMMRWAREAGYIDYNPLAGAMNPWHPQDQRRPLTGEEYQKIMAGARDEQFRLLLRVLWSSGCRPGEAFVLRGDHLHPLQPIATLQPGEHKTGGRTGKCRYLIFPKAVMEDLRRQAEKYPTGPLLRNTLGHPWERRHVSNMFRLLRNRLGLPSHVVPYAMRHSMATDLAHGSPEQPSIFLAKIIGHSNEKTFEAVYYHPEMQAMIAAVEKERGEPTAPAPPSAEGSGSPAPAAPTPPEAPGTPG